MYRQGLLSEYYIKSESNIWNTFFVDTMHRNEIYFTKIDTINFILEGNLYFEGIDGKGNRKIISEGEFRQHYRF